MLLVILKGAGLGIVVSVTLLIIILNMGDGASNIPEINFALLISLIIIIFILNNIILYKIKMNYEKLKELLKK